jgi:N-acetylmuramoyl-L-alanine amidase
LLTQHPCRRLAVSIVVLACLAPALSHAVAADPPTVTVTVDASADSTRIMLTHSRRVGYVIESARGDVRVRYAEPVDLQPATARFEDRILKRYRMRDPRTLRLDTGSKYDRYESFELLHPFRLVLDLKSAPKVVRDRGRRSAPRQASTIIVIDPGHGGTEEGAVGSAGLLEKDVTLAIARRLKRDLERNSPSVQVVLTRDEDRLVGLDERTAIANHNRADLFLSIHLNASPRATARGAETYYLSTAPTDQEARMLAELENDPGDVARKRPHERVAEGSLDLVLWDLAQNQYVAESGALAESIQDQLNRLTGMRDRGVRQAPFRVLMGAMMPAVLVEVGFVSNEEDETLLASSTYRMQIVRALSAAVEDFLRDLTRYSAPDSPDSGVFAP